MKSSLSPCCTFFFFWPIRSCHGDSTASSSVLSVLQQPSPCCPPLGPRTDRQRLSLVLLMKQWVTETVPGWLLKVWLLRPHPLLRLTGQLQLRFWRQDKRLRVLMVRFRALFWPESQVNRIQSPNRPEPRSKRLYSGDQDQLLEFL